MVVGRLSHLCCNDSPVLLPQISCSVFLLLSEVWELLDLCLVQAVDDGVLPLRDVDTLDFLLVLKADLAGGHAAVFLQVRPRCVDDCDVVLLVACCSVSVPFSRSLWIIVLTLDRVGLGQLCAVFQKRLRDILP